MYHNHLVFVVDSGLTVDVGFEKWITPDGLSKKAEKQYVIDKKNINYILPDVRIPRFKIKMFADDNKMRNTNKLESATHIIFSDYSIFRNYNDVGNSQVEYDNSIQRHKTNDFIERIEELINAGYTNYVSEKVLQKLKILSKTNKYIYARSRDSNRFYAELYYRKMGRWYGSHPGEEYPIIVSDLLEQVFEENPNIKFVNEREVQKHISTNAIVIDHKKYQELVKLFDTMETDNVVLAMEIMANCNFSKSLIFIYMLLIQKGNIMDSYGKIDHVNFKYLLNYFNYDKSKLSNNGMDPSQVEQIFSVLHDHNQFTKQNVDLFLSYYNEKMSYSIYEGSIVNNKLNVNASMDYDDIDDHDEVNLDDL
jgi:hypothetical protein